MNTKRAEKLLQKHNLTLLRWNGTFTAATVRATDGLIHTVDTIGGAEKVTARIAELKLPPKP